MQLLCTGLLCARQAVAKHHSTPEAPLTEDVIERYDLIYTIHI